jgi:hypothetical protein
MRPSRPEGASRDSASSRPSVRPRSDRRPAGPARDASTLVASLFHRFAGARPSASAGTSCQAAPQPWPGSPERLPGCRRNGCPGHRNGCPGAVGTAARVTGMPARVPSERVPGSGRNGCPSQAGIRTMGPRKRCTEWRQWYEAASSARDTQKVCSAECRWKRRRKLVRQRRWDRVLDARDEERERQRAFRARRRAEVVSAAATPEASPARPSSSHAVRDGPDEARHAPPSSANDREVLGKVLECWDREMARSRATLQRRIAGILQGSRASAGTAREGPAPLSRAPLGL